MCSGKEPSPCALNHQLLSMEHWEGQLSGPWALFNLDPVGSCSHTCQSMLPELTQRHINLDGRLNKTCSGVNGESLHLNYKYPQELDFPSRMIKISESCEYGINEPLSHSPDNW